MVKFKNGRTDLTQIEIVLTDFGMAGPDTTGGTPIFASPECYERKTIKSDIFSLGRVLLFVLLPKEKFMKWLFVPIQPQRRPNSSSVINLVADMTSISNRIDLQEARERFNSLRRKFQIKPPTNVIDLYDRMVINKNIDKIYIDHLCELRYESYHMTLNCTNSLKIVFYSNHSSKRL